MEKISIEIKGMTCKHCVALVKENLEAVAGVKKADVNLKKGVAEVKGEGIAVEDLIGAIQKEGFTASAL